jgi:hypothetical protein
MGEVVLPVAVAQITTALDRRNAVERDSNRVFSRVTADALSIRTPLTNFIARAVAAAGDVNPCLSHDHVFANSIAIYMKQRRN